MTSRTVKDSLELSLFSATQISVEITYEFEAAERGARERSTGLQLEPDYPAGVAITAVEAKHTDRAGKVHTIDLLPLLSPDHVASLESKYVEEELEGAYA